MLPPRTSYTVGKTPFLAVTRKAPSKTDTLLSCFRKKKVRLWTAGRVARSPGKMIAARKICRNRATG